jgi:hypothetical protein
MAITRWTLIAVGIWLCATTAPVTGATCIVIAALGV